MNDLRSFRGYISTIAIYHCIEMFQNYRRNVTQRHFATVKKKPIIVFTIPCRGMVGHVVLNMKNCVSKTVVAYKYARIREILCLTRLYSNWRGCYVEK